MEDAVEVAAVMEVRLAYPFSLGLLVLLTPGFEQFAVGQKGWVHELGLVLELDPVPGLMGIAWNVAGP